MDPSSFSRAKEQVTKVHNGFLPSHEKNKQMSIILSNVNCVLTKYLNIAYYQFPRVRTQNQLTIDQVHQIYVWLHEETSQFAGSSRKRVNPGVSHGPRDQSGAGIKRVRHYLSLFLHLILSPF